MYYLVVGKINVCFSTIANIIMIPKINEELIKDDNNCWI